MTIDGVIQNEENDGDEVRRLEHPDFQRFAAQRVPQCRTRGKSKGLKQQDAPDIYVMGNARLLQTLF